MNDHEQEVFIYAGIVQILQNHYLYVFSVGGV